MTAATTKAATITAATPAAVDPAKAKVAQGLQSFINAMREGVNNAKDKIDERLKAGELRTDALVSKGTSQSFDLVNLVAKNCDITADVLNCTDVTFLNEINDTKHINYVRINSTKYCFYHTLFDDADNDKYTVSGNFEATQNETTGAASGKLDATTTTYYSGNSCSSNNTNTKVSELSMALTGSGLKSGSTSGDFTISTLKFKVYDQAANSSKWVQMALSGISIAATKDRNKNLATSTLTAPLVVTSSEGDDISGRVTATVKELCTNGASPCIKRSYTTKIDMSFSGTLKEGAIASFTVNATQAVAGFGEAGYHPYSPNSADNPINRTATLTMTFSDNVTIALSENFTAWDKSNLGVNFTSNGATLYMTAERKYKSAGTNEQVLNGAIDVKSSGIYRATLREGNDNKGAGEVFKGDTQIGNIAGGVLYLRNTDGSNGRIISLK